MERKQVPQTFSTRVELYNKIWVKEQVGKDNNFCYSKAHFSFCSRIRQSWFSLNPIKLIKIQQFRQQLGSAQSSLLVLLQTCVIHRARGCDLVRITISVEGYLSTGSTIRIFTTNRFSNTNTSISPLGKRRTGDD